ncbi:hypothetical protein [Bacillus sp. C28GYM-DRY-1]|uniref:hypothetical protein n=1 Tax=Bacillus sp. C28GYM-DRY-1 TaxID=3062686 RepID=UPI002676760B|nr:hypothetical protein [Bacillus sp. C28GYM-DRY-1]MDO3662894.1 hypothetical protein [Bacillus sp. C28GYM-DRY-1]
MYHGLLNAGDIKLGLSHDKSLREIGGTTIIVKRRASFFNRPVESETDCRRHRRISRFMWRIARAAVVRGKEVIIN